MASASIFDLIEKELVVRVTEIVKLGEVDLNARNEEVYYHPTPLIASIERGCLPLVQALLVTKSKKKPDVNRGDKFGRRPLTVAIEGGFIGIIRLLLRVQQLDVKYVDEASGKTPLHLAVTHGYAQVVEWLIKAGSDVNLRCTHSKQHGVTPLITATRKGDLAIVRSLVSSLCKINEANSDGLTALHVAAAEDHVDVCRFLLQNKAKVILKSKHGITPMVVAIARDNYEICQLLLDYGYPAHRPFMWHETPLEMAVRLHSEASASMLLAANVPFSPSLAYEAATENCFHLLMFIIYLEPSVLNEQWLLEEDWPINVNTDTRIDQLHALLHHPLPLRDLCRARIFRLYGRHPVAKLKQLQLTDNLKSYLTFKDFRSVDSLRRLYDNHHQQFECEGIEFYADQNRFRTRPV